MERRYIKQPAIRMTETDGKTKIVGYAVRFNQLSVELFGFREKIAPGAFATSLADGDIRALWQHDRAAVLGRTRAGTLALSEDEIGVGFMIDVADTQIGRDALVSIDRGDVDGMSFSFSILPDGEQWSEDESGQLVRTVTAATLYEISPVTFPAYPSTSAEARALWGDAVTIPADVLRAKGIGVDDRELDAARARFDIKRKLFDLLPED